MYKSSVFLIYPHSSGLDWLGMTHSVWRKGASDLTWIDSILILGFIMLSVNNSGLNIYSYGHDPFVCSKFHLLCGYVLAIWQTSSYFYMLTELHLNMTIRSISFTLSCTH